MSRNQRGLAGPIARDGLAVTAITADERRAEPLMTPDQPAAPVTGRPLRKGPYAGRQLLKQSPFCFSYAVRVRKSTFPRSEEFVVRPDAFTSHERGRVRKTVDGYWAFFPTETPRRISLSDEAVKLLDEATAAVHRLGGVGRLVPNPHLLIGPHLRLEAVLSSRIEGTKTDVGQLLRFEAGQVPSADAADDAAEVSNYVVALEHGLARIREGVPVSVRLLREMHEKLLHGVRGQHRRPGELRSSPVWIGGATLDDAVFVPPPPEDMVRALGDLEQFLHERDLPLLVQLAVADYQFEVVHPFLDGNGRIGRLLIPLMLVLRDALPSRSSTSRRTSSSTEASTTTTY